MRIDVFSDSVCPWCFVGKRHLEAALASVNLSNADIHWHAFQLNPDLPPQGRDRREYLEEKFGTVANVESLHARVAEAGHAAGIEFQFGKISRSPNTFNSHRLIHLAQTHQRADAMVETLFRGYFLEGLDIGDDGMLTQLAQIAGVEGDIATWLGGEGERIQVLEDLRAARELGIGGVPFFIFNNHYALSGAQPVEIFAQAMHAAQQKARKIN
ncbi:MAG TPA: DsbA family oxidoreductase [Gammaproteobacteria bacterium]|nr:DsbA family oxidoreductase [Gammaproteobacteria bacterium]